MGVVLWWGLCLPGVPPYQRGVSGCDVTGCVRGCCDGCCVVVGVVPTWCSPISKGGNRGVTGEYEGVM